MEITDIYDTWQVKWELANPKPEIPARDILLYSMQIVVATGAVFLSGSRTGNAVARIGSLAEFGSRISYLGLNEGIFSTFEAFLAFATFDAGILLAGYLTGDNKASKRWYWVLFAASIIPALSANILPGLELIGLEEKGHVITDVIIGVFTPFMAFVAGRVIGATERERQFQITSLLGGWEEKKKRAWERSRDYRDFLKAPKKQKKIKVEDKPETDIRQAIIDYINGNGAKHIDELSSHFEMAKSEVLAIVMELEKESLVIREGFKVTTPDV